MDPAVVALAEASVETHAPAGLNWSRAPDGVMGTAYLDLMMREFSAFLDVVGKLDIEERYREIRASEGRAALNELSSALNKVATDTLDAVGESVWELAPGKALAVSKEGLKNAVATVAGYAANGLYLHLDGVMFQGLNEGVLTSPEVKEHADQVTRIFQSFVSLDSSGAFNEIYRQEAQAGLGIAPLAIPAWMLVVAGVVLVLGLAYLVWSTYRASTLQDKVVAWCDKLIADNPSNAGRCMDSLENMQNAGLDRLFSPLSSVIKWAGVGLLLYIAVLAAPPLLRGIGEFSGRRRSA